jgi:hypothetical protein
MPQPGARSNGAGVIDGLVYVPGGQGTNGVYTNSVYAYNPATNTWTSKATMPVASGCGGSGVLGGKLYVHAICRADGSSQPGVIGEKFYLAGGYVRAVESTGAVEESASGRISARAQERQWEVKG